MGRRCGDLVRSKCHGRRAGQDAGGHLRGRKLRKAVGRGDKDKQRVDGRVRT